MGGKYNMKINFMKMRNTAIQELKIDESTTKQCVIIPVEDNKIFVSEKTGSAYAEFECIPLKQMQYFQSHIIRLKYPEEDMEKLTKEEIHDITTLGSLTPVRALIQNWKNKTKGAYDPKEPESNISGKYHKAPNQDNRDIKKAQEYDGWTF